MHRLHLIGASLFLLSAACTSSAPPSPTTAPAAAPTAVPTKPAASPASSPAASPAAAVASPSAAAKPAVSPASSPAASPAASPVGSPVAISVMILSGTATPGFALTSSAIAEGAAIPQEYTCAVTGQAGSGASPPLAWSGAPATAKAFALVEQDMDVPPPNGPVTHWMIFNIPGTETSLATNVPTDETLSNGTKQGLNSRRTIGYLGACPPPGTTPHRYVFQLFALDGPVSLPSPATIVDLQKAMEDHIVGQTQLRAMFGR